MTQEQPENLSIDSSAIEESSQNESSQNESLQNETAPSESPKSTESPDFFPPVDDPEILRVVALGARPVVNRFVHQLHHFNVAHYSEWTRLIPTPNPGEFMRMLTKRIVIDPPAIEPPAR